MIPSATLCLEFGVAYEVIGAEAEKGSSDTMSETEVEDECKEL